MQTLTIVALVAVLPFILGGLLGHSINECVRRQENRRLAAARRLLGAQRRAILAYRACGDRPPCQVCIELITAFDPPDPEDPSAD